MKRRMPQYCQAFHCIADRCSDNCCIGWEIDIDEAAAVHFAAQEGAFGERLRQHISWDGVPHFILDAAERCPFLDEMGLCDIYRHMGEAALCQICTDHPRYYEWFGDVCEGGIGLCCEEAARIILSQTQHFAVEETTVPGTPDESPDEDLYSCLYAAREAILTHLQRNEQPLFRRISDVLCYADALQMAIDQGEFPSPLTALPTEAALPMDDAAKQAWLKDVMGLYQELEQLAETWQGTLEAVTAGAAEIAAALPAFRQAHPEAEGYLQNAAVYFIWRYWLKGVWNGEFLSHAKLMAVSAALLETLYCHRWLQTGDLTFEDCVQLTKDYSKEIEYSEENLNALADAGYEEACLSLEALCGYLEA